MLIALASLDLFVWIGLTSWLEPKQMKTSPSEKKHLLVCKPFFDSNLSDYLQMLELRRDI